MLSLVEPDRDTSEEERAIEVRTDTTREWIETRVENDRRIETAIDEMLEGFFNSPEEELPEAVKESHIYMTFLLDSKLSKLTNDSPSSPEQCAAQLRIITAAQRLKAAGKHGVKDDAKAAAAYNTIINDESPDDTTVTQYIYDESPESNAILDDFLWDSQDAFSREFHNNRCSANAQADSYAKFMHSSLSAKALAGCIVNLERREKNMQEAYDKSLRELVSPELMKKIRFRASEILIEDLEEKTPDALESDAAAASEPTNH